MQRNEPKNRDILSLINTHKRKYGILIEKENWVEEIEEV